MSSSCLGVNVTLPYQKIFQSQKIQFSFNLKEETFIKYKPYLFIAIETEILKVEL